MKLSKTQKNNLRHLYHKEKESLLELANNSSKSNVLDERLLDIHKVIKDIKSHPLG